MTRRRALLLTLVAVVFVIVAVVGLGAASNDTDPDERESGIELGGMRMDDSELREMSRDAMGVADLADVPEASPSSATSEMAGTLRGNTRTFELTARPVRWEYRDGQHVAAWGYEGQVPGPTLRANEGERVRVVFHNELTVPTTVHWHGLDVPWRQDGVPGVTQHAIEPGASHTYEFTATPSGTRWYHTHGAKMGEEAAQLDMGLAGALLVADRTRSSADVDEVLVLDEWNIGPRGYNAAMMAGHGGHGDAYNVFTVNGRAMPDIEDVVVKRGDLVRLRLVNASTMSIHPIHLHGHQVRVVALDGNPVPQAQQRTVVTLNPGETADVEFRADNPGVWMLHCHELHHADGGMAMLVRYEGFQPVGDDDDDDEEHDA